jgi:hypothetical protein
MTTPCNYLCRLLIVALFGTGLGFTAGCGSDAQETAQGKDGSTRGRPRPDGKDPTGAKTPAGKTPAPGGR